MKYKKTALLSIISFIIFTCAVAQVNGDSAWAKLEKMEGQIPAGKEAYQEYAQLRPLGKKRFEDQHLLMRMQLAEAFWKNYPQHPKRLDALRFFLSTDPYFIAAYGNESLDTIEQRPGLDWAAMLRSVVTDTAARKNGWHPVSRSCLQY